MLTDPTFDPPGEYPLPHTTLVKTAGPARTLDEIGHIDVVLLSHDQHADNLDHAGRRVLERATRVITTPSAAKRLGRPAEGLAPWATTTLSGPAKPDLNVTATPARHGPVGIEPIIGEVTGFVIQGQQIPEIYITGDTVWYEGVSQVAQRFSPRILILFAGAARTRGAFSLTMDVNGALETAYAFPESMIIPVHCDGWKHFSQGRDDLELSFQALGVAHRLHLPSAGVPLEIA